NCLGDRRRRRGPPAASREIFHGVGEAGSGEEPFERDRIALRLAAAAVEQLLFGIDGETVGPAANRTRANALDAPAKSDAVRGNDVFDPNRAGALDRLGGDHSNTCSTRGNTNA